MTPKQHAPLVFTLCCTLVLADRHSPLFLCTDACASARNAICMCSYHDEKALSHNFRARTGETEALSTASGTCPCGTDSKNWCVPVFQQLSSCPRRCSGKQDCNNCPDGYRTCHKNWITWCCDRASSFDRCGDQVGYCLQNVSESNNHALRRWKLPAMTRASSSASPPPYLGVSSPSLCPSFPFSPPAALVACAHLWQGHRGCLR